MARTTRRPAQVALGLVVLTAAYAKRFPVGGGQTASWFDVGLLIIAPASLFLGANRRDRAVRPAYPRLIIGSALLVAALSVASFGWTQDKGQTLLHAVSWIEAAIAVAFCSSRAAILRPDILMRWVARLAWLLLLGGVLLELKVPGFGVPADVGRLTGDYASYFSRFSHPFLGRSNNLATVLLLLFLPLAWWAARYRRHRLIAALTGVGIVATLSRGVLLALVVAAVLASPSARRNARRFTGYLLAIAFMGVLVVAVLALTVPAVGEFFRTRLRLTNVADRADLLHFGNQQITSHPLLGIGAGGGDNIHNTFVQQLVYFGIALGAVAAIAIIRVPLWFFRRRSPVASICGWAVVGVWLSCLVESSLEGKLLLPEVFFAIGLLAALCLSWERYGPPPAEYARPRRAKRPMRSGPTRPITPKVRAPHEATPVEELSPEWQRAFGIR